MTQLFFIAFRNLTRNTRRTLLALGAMVVGLFVLTALRGFVNSVQAAQLDSMVYGFTGMLQVHKTGYMKNVLGNPLNLNFADTAELRQKILSVSGVKALAPRIVFSGIYSAPEIQEQDGTAPSEARATQQTSFFAASAVDPELERIVAPKFFEWIVQGRMLGDRNAREIIINADVAESLGARIKPASDTSAPPADTLWPVILAQDPDGSLNGEAVYPVGLMGSVVPGDKRYALVPLSTAQNLLRMDNRITEFIVSLEDIDQAKRVQGELRQTLGSDFEVHRWDEVLPFLKDLLVNVERIFGIITFIFVLVVLLGVVNTMFMNVLERTREIGTMLAVGVRRSQIMGLFIIEGAILGIVGGIIGEAVGFGIVLTMHHFGIRIPAPGSNIALLLRPEVSFSYMFTSALAASLGAAFVSIWPALKASRLRPVEALSST